MPPIKQQNNHKNNKNKNNKNNMNNNMQSFVDGFPNTAYDEISVASFNVLNQAYIRPGQFKTDPAFLEWEHRFGKQQALFKRLNADVICLQEVQTENFDMTYLAFFKSQGYDGMLQKVDHLVGTATFFKRDKFDLIYQESRSRALILGLNMKIPFEKDEENDNENENEKDKEETSSTSSSSASSSDTEPEEDIENDLENLNLNNNNSLKNNKYWNIPVQIANVHLQSGWKNGATRMNQMKSLLKQCQARLIGHINTNQNKSKKSATTPENVPMKTGTELSSLTPEQQQTISNSLTFICGDFNNNPDSGACAVLSKGFLEAGAKDEAGNEVTSEEFHHPFQLTNVCCQLTPEDRHPTHLGYEDHAEYLDHVFAPCQLLDVIGMFAIRKGEIQEMLKTCLPNREYPSDHLPVGGMFKMKTKFFERAKRKADEIT